MIPRTLSTVLVDTAKNYPILAILGPRQSGKTTLAKSLFPKHKYLSLENPDIRRLAETDPRSLLEDFGGALILDEVQRCPDLFSYLQEKVDEDPTPGRYILTGSQQFLLMQNISQTLAGRSAYFRLFPFSNSELIWKKSKESFLDILSFSKFAKRNPPDLLEMILKGFYPPIHDKKLEPRRWIENYIESYVERDVRSIVNVSDLRQFENFLRLTASYAGQLVNYASISNAIGVSEPTVKRWLSVLETSGIIFLLPPWFENLSKRIVKSPKLYFVDTGILSYLLSIRDKENLVLNSHWGAVFENFVVAEFYKRFYHVGEKPQMYFYRDKTGLEVDLLVQTGSDVIPIETKASLTWNENFSFHIQKWISFQKKPISKGYVIYRGDAVLRKKDTVTCLPWWGI